MSRAADPTARELPALSAAGIRSHELALGSLDARAEAGHELSTIITEVQRFTDLGWRAGWDRRPIRLVFHATREGSLHRQMRLQEATGLAISNRNAGFPAKVILGVASHVHAVLAPLAPFITVSGGADAHGGSWGFGPLG
jgi:hypothetical protein